ncbi:hypothetical protein [Rhizobium sp. NLR22b]|uniref:hypothetical protein n=1 Tax=Rhizobium sp. NLR22b TaxID=2731115 RepID=UPI001C835102|nr:hypothetical protein [Rhizobium sp. NLR22b]MBX5238043.1 hypothetical protein [Rhizobium sp. NLR22b]
MDIITQSIQPPPQGGFMGDKWASYEKPQFTYQRANYPCAPRRSNGGRDRD